MLNQIVCVGRLCKDLELKYTPQGLAICENTLALNRKMKDKPDKAIFIKIVCFGKGAEILNQYAKKGDRIGVVGEIDFKEWQDNQGKRHTQNFISVEKIELLESKPQVPQAQKQYQTPPQDRGAQKAQSMPTIDLDEIPF